MSSTSDVEIVNSGLIKIGADTITSLDDDAKAATLTKRQFPILRNEVLRGHPWNFARRRAKLAQLADAPAFGFSNAYQLPTDCLRVVEMSDPTIRFVIEGRQLLTDESAASIEYIAEITDPNQFDAFFRETLALRIAADLAFNLVDSLRLAKAMMDLYLDHLAKARTFDAQEGGGQEKIEATTWTDERL